MNSKIPQKRMLLYLLVAGCIPFLFVLIGLMSHLSELDELQDSLQRVQAVALARDKKQALNNIVRSHYRDADHFYIDKQLETTSLLEPEIEAVQKILQHKNAAEDEQIKKRLEQLTSGNTMSFSEGVVQTYPDFQETTETLVHPVEVNSTDLSKILSKVEGIDIGSFTPGPNRPQLIILDFKLERKKNIDKNEVFLLNMKLLKREFL